MGRKEATALCILSDGNLRGAASRAHYRHSDQPMCRLKAHYPRHAGRHVRVDHETVHDSKAGTVNPQQGSHAGEEGNTTGQHDLGHRARAR